MWQLNLVFCILVAADVLKQDKLELEGYHLQLKEQPPELILPFDRKKLYLENIGPTTTKDSLRYYLEAITKSDVSDLKFGTGDNRNALAILMKNQVCYFVK